MQTFEALVSATVFLFMLSSILLGCQVPYALDDSLYRYQLVNDAWRVLYLRGDFEGFGPSGRAAFESDADAIREMTGLCIFMDGVRYTNCRGGDEAHEILASVKKVVIEDGEPKQVSFSIAR